VSELHKFSTEKEWAEINDSLDDPVILGQTGYIIDFGKGIYRDFCTTAPVARLNRIRQLGIASYCRNTGMADQTRYAHSLFVATKLDDLAQKFDLDRNTAVAAGLLHDIASPALSDSIGNGLGMSDEAGFRSVLYDHPEVGELLKKYGVRAGTLVEMVQGKDLSPLGRLLSSKDALDVDRWAYTNIDASMTNDLPQKWDRSHRFIDPFKSMEIIEGNIVFTDVPAITELLYGRARMFTKHYHGSEVAAKEAFLGRLVQGLRKEHLLDSDKALEMTDDDMEAFLRKYHPEETEQLFRFGWNYKEYARFHPAYRDKIIRNRLKKLTDADFIVEKGRGFNTAIKTLIKDANGKITTFEKANPRYAAALKDCSDYESCVCVFGREGDKKLEEAVGKLTERCKSIVMGEDRALYFPGGFRQKLRQFSEM